MPNTEYYLDIVKLYGVVNALRLRYIYLIYTHRLPRLYLSPPTFLTFILYNIYIDYTIGLIFLITLITAVFL